jgi:predicted aspartyl protease
MVGLADGRQIPAKLIKLSTVRVGKFTAENVECVVLGEQANNAFPLLGISFL